MTPTQSAQAGLALALSRSEQLDAWCKEHPWLATAIVEQLARYSLRLTPGEFAAQIARRLTAAQAVGVERAAQALGLDVQP